MLYLPYCWIKPWECDDKNKCKVWFSMQRLVYIMYLWSNICQVRVCQNIRNNEIIKRKKKHKEFLIVYWDEFVGELLNLTTWWFRWYHISRERIHFFACRQNNSNSKAIVPLSTWYQYASYFYFGICVGANAFCKYLHMCMSTYT